MPGLIHRHNIVEEYSTFITTNPSSVPLHHARRVRRNSDSPPSKRAAIVDEATAWRDALLPPLSEVQEVITRLNTDPEFRQGDIFSFLSPLVIFVVLMTVVAVAVQPNSFAHRILDSPGNHTRDIIHFMGILFGSVIGSLIALRCVIWGLVEFGVVIVKMESRQEAKLRERKGVPTSNLVLGGFCM
ncbi:hypothetical protein BN946_scf184998.g56 [Trametes cinnabarina]|uniref:Uncharacterized protein n=1 Tax=Pycnoporus cinnabarinus TaxID=5643 RepID=A0A060S8F3_PYCCI|nr:hypothetical protein BN946_scf184998.g56 [Trametes cinnabarina]